MFLYTSSDSRPLSRRHTHHTSHRERHRFVPNNDVVDGPILKDDIACDGETQSSSSSNYTSNLRSQNIVCYKHCTKHIRYNYVVIAAIFIVMHCSTYYRWGTLLYLFHLLNEGCQTRGFSKDHIVFWIFFKSRKQFLVYFDIVCLKHNFK